ncbi:MAG: TetR/AcrR family transcriptional regulator [Acidimicrobiales bacterium]
MGRSTADEVLEAEDSAPTAAQARTIAASLELFAQEGVGGTSLQMIADAVGVTKAAIYHQFNTKDEIVLAAGEAELRRLESVLDTAEAAPSMAKARQVLLAGIVDLAVERRKTMSVILSDPVVLRFFATQESYHRMIDRFTNLLIGPRSGDHGHIQTAMFMAALSGAVMHPMVANLDDETLRSELLRLARRFR